MSDLLKKLISESKNIVFFTGAGISTESGIPDFRSPGGLWTRMKPILFQDFISSEKIRIESWNRKFDVKNDISFAKPNTGHKVIAKLIKNGKASYVITQNIDNLHQSSGIPENKIIELHGNSSYAKCLECKSKYELQTVKEEFQSQPVESRKSPCCKKCGGIIKTATISFGQPMPAKEMKAAESATLASDLFIAIGSSLQVYPAASFPILASNNGAKLVIINRETTGLDKIANLVINEEIGITLQSAV